MLNFDPTTHANLLPFRDCLKSWWSSRPKDVVGLALYGSRAKNCAADYSDWDVVIFTSSQNPDADKICRDLPRVHDQAPIHALCESIEDVRSNAKYGGSLRSAITEQGVSLFGASIRFEEDTIKQPSYDSAEMLFSAVLEALKGFLSEANIRYRKSKSQDKDATTHSVHVAEYLVKSFMSVRGVNYRHSHNVEELCEQMAALSPNDPLVCELRKLDGSTARGHLGPYQFLHIHSERLKRTTERVYGALALLPHLAEDIFSGREVSKVTKEIISDKLSVLQREASGLIDSELHSRVQSTLDAIGRYFD